jgi:tetratricopeptide (TPR) repeat protein
MVGLFYLLTLFCLLRGAEGTRTRLGWYAGCVLCCALGMLTKEVMCTAPLLALLYDRIFLAPSWWQVLRRRAVLHLALAATLVILTPSLINAFALPKASVAARTEQLPPAPDADISAGFGMITISWQQYARTQPQVILHYLRLALWPDSLCLDYRWPIADPSSAVLPGVLVGALVLLTLIALFRWPPLGFVGTWFFLILAPTSSILPISDLAVEHRLYLPLAAVVLLVVLAAQALVQFLARRGVNPRLLALLRPALVGGVIVVLGLLTYARNWDYESELRMWADVVVKRPANARAHNNLGNAFKKRKQLADATRHYRMAVRLSPGYALAHYNLGGALLEQGVVEHALAEFRSAVLHDPALSRAHNNLGNLLMGRGELTRAAHHLREAMRLCPTDPLAPLNLGMTLQLQDDWQGAADAYRRAVALRWDNADSRRGLAFVLRRLGQTAEAQKEYAHSLRLQPGWPASALRNAWDLATNPDPGLRYGKVAVHFAMQAVEAASEQEDPRSLDVLAAAFAEAGRFEEAVPTARKALAFARARGQTDLVGAIEQRLRGYENKQPFRAGLPPKEAP